MISELRSGVDGPCLYFSEGPAEACDMEVFRESESDEFQVTFWCTDELDSEQAGIILDKASLEKLHSWIGYMLEHEEVPTGKTL